jgi:hypothetical protein
MPNDTDRPDEGGPAATLRKSPEETTTEAGGLPPRERRYAMAAVLMVVALTILVTGTTVGDVVLRKGAKLRLPKGQAETLANLTPPAAQITGI